MYIARLVDALPFLSRCFPVNQNYDRPRETLVRES